MPNETRTVVAAAVRLVGGEVHSLPAPARHHHIIHALAEQGRRQQGGDVQGFLLSNGQFADRCQAGQIACDGGQIDALKWPPSLYSEDLW